jgi:hypothetical protein
MRRAARSVGSFGEDWVSPSGSSAESSFGQEPPSRPDSLFAASIEMAASPQSDIKLHGNHRIAPKDEHAVSLNDGLPR